ncbi:hypothetical protein ACH42_05465 [Endozoicomonas sp. (ex Bugula neritina AB1)]|nr:hypothetical protein ACH42_05465 [Endozoicomonas sp. (ex Bugula neritina AB1)]
MHENGRSVQDLPLSIIKVNLLFTAYLGRCSNCNHIETVAISGLAPKAQATDRLKRHVTHLYPLDLEMWIKLAKDTGTGELKRFANGLNRARERLLSYCQHRITSAKIEALSGVIKRIVYKACGYNDLEYLYLKIRQEALK